MDKWRKHLSFKRLLVAAVVLLFLVYVNFKLKSKDTRVVGPKDVNFKLESKDTRVVGPTDVNFKLESKDTSVVGPKDVNFKLESEDTRVGPKEHDMSPGGLGTPGPYHVAYPRDYKFVMDDTEVCKAETPFVILMVPVAPSNAAARDAVRKTWGKETTVEGKLVRTLFLIGLPSGAGALQLQENLKRESLLHHDLIQSDFQDSYRNLTIKTMVMLEWLTAHCPSAAFVMKIDSDMFLNTRNLVKLLVDPGTPRQNYMTGLVWWHSPVLRDPNNKFHMPKDVVPESEYPPYPLGMSYVMSLDLPGKILGVAPQIKPIYIEDAYLGMCLKRLGISPTDPPDKSMFIVNPFFALTRCGLSKVIAVTTTSIPQMMDYWEKNMESGAPC